MSAARLTVDVRGPEDAPPLVMGASLGTTAAMWEPQIDTLARHFRVVRYDHRGHGGSEAPDGPYSIDALGHDVLAMLDTINLERVSYCGLSLGGMIGMWLAANAPQRVERLALVCTSAQLGPETMWRERAARVRARGTAPEVEAAIGRWFTPGFVARRGDVVAAAGRWLSSVSGEGYAGCCEAIAGMDLRGVLPAIAAPTLVVAGAEDVAIPVDHAEIIAAGIPGAVLSVIPDAGHLANLEQPEAMTRLLLDHLLGVTT